MSIPTKVKHRHRYRMQGYSGKEIDFKCSCGERKSRPRTKADEAALQDRSKDIHKVWHAFNDKFRDTSGLDYPFRFKYKSYDLMHRAERWAKKFPEDVRVVRCDDAVHANSTLVLIEHKSPACYMGTSVVFIPQCTGDDPIIFFLYPQHLDALTLALAQIKKASKVIQKAEAVVRKTQSDAMAKLRP